MSEMRLDRLAGDEQGSGDLGIAETFDGEVGDTSLGGRKFVDAGASTRARLTARGAEFGARPVDKRTGLAPLRQIETLAKPSARLNVTVAAPHRLVAGTPTRADP